LVQALAEKVLAATDCQKKHGANALLLHKKSCGAKCLCGVAVWNAVGSSNTLWHKGQPW
jgi:hypothetical protein